MIFLHKSSGTCSLLLGELTMGYFWKDHTTVSRHQNTQPNQSHSGAQEENMGQAVALPLAFLQATPIQTGAVTKCQHPTTINRLQRWFSWIFISPWVDPTVARATPGATSSPMAAPLVLSAVPLALLPGLSNRLQRRHAKKRHSRSWLGDRRRRSVMAAPVELEGHPLCLDKWFKWWLNSWLMMINDD